MFIGRTDAKAETPILWPPDAKNWLIWKDPDAEKDWRQEKKGTTEDETVEWYHQLNGHEFEQALGVGDGQGGLVCCSPWCDKESDMNEWLNWPELKISPECSLEGLMLKRKLQWFDHLMWRANSLERTLMPSFSYIQLSRSYDYWKTIVLTRWTFVGKVMFLLFNMLSRLVITFLPRVIY